MENDPFYRINKILTETDLENIGYAKLKSLLTFFISGNSRRAKLSKVVNDFKNCKLTEGNTDNFKQNNQTAFDKKVTSFVEGEYEKEHIREKFETLLEYTYELLELTTIEPEKYIKNTIKKGVKDTNNFLLHAFDLDGRILRKKHKALVGKIDRVIKEKKEDGYIDDLGIKIKDIMGKYDHNSTEFKNLISELGLKIKKKKDGGGDGCEDGIKKDNLVGYLSVKTVEAEPPAEAEETGVAVRLAAAARLAASAAAAAAAGLYGFGTLLTGIGAEFNEHDHYNVYSSASTVQQFSKKLEYRANRFYTRVYYTLENNMKDNNDFLKRLHFIYKYEEFFNSKIQNNNHTANTLLGKFKESLQNFIENSSYLNGGPNIKKSPDELDLLKICAAGCNYFSSLTTGEAQPLNITYDDTLKQKIIDTVKKLLADELKLIIDMDALSKESRIGVSNEIINGILDRIKNITPFENNTSLKELQDYAITPLINKISDKLNIVVLRNILVKTIAELYINYLKKFAETSDITKYVDYLKIQENTYYKTFINHIIYFNESKLETSPLSTSAKTTQSLVENLINIQKDSNFIFKIKNNTPFLSEWAILKETAFKPSDSIKGFIEHINDKIKKNPPSSLDDKLENEIGTYFDSTQNTRGVSQDTKSHEEAKKKFKLELTPSFDSSLYKKLITNLKTFIAERHELVVNFKELKDSIIEGFHTDDYTYSTQLNNSYNNSLKYVKQISVFISGFGLLRGHVKNNTYLNDNYISRFFIIATIFDKDLKSPGTQNVNEMYTYYMNVINDDNTVYQIGNLTAENLEQDFKFTYSTHSVGGGTLNLLMIQDRIHFILLLFIIRTIATFIINVSNIKTVSQSSLLYFIIYVGALLLFVFLANSNIEGFAELFYYLNTNTEDGRGILRIILQFTCICALIPIPYIVKDKKELNDITLYILILASFLTVFI